MQPLQYLDICTDFKVALNLSVLLDATPRGAWFTIIAWGLAFAQLCARVEFFAHAIVPTAAGS